MAFLVRRLNRLFAPSLVRRNPFLQFSNLQSRIAPCIWRAPARSFSEEAAEAMDCRDITLRQGEILKELQNIEHPETKQDIIDMNLVKGVNVLSDGVVQIELGVDKEYRHLKKRVQEVVQKLDWTQDVRITMAKTTKAKPEPHPKKQAGNGLKDVKHILAVGSCKGGVGKSTVAVNVAYSLARLGQRVGIFDADIHGPSLSTMVSPKDRDLYINADGFIEPPVYEDVKTMTYGYVKGQKDNPLVELPWGDNAGPSAVMRGPMVSQVLTQLLTQTDWGDLDFLVVDMPPGTGDIQLTLSQQIQISAGLLVTTPQKLSVIDVVKGVEMFDTVKVPILGIVQNMASFTCTNCSEVHYPFGEGYGNLFKNQFGFKHIFSTPIVAQISTAGDTGRPSVLSDSAALESVREEYTKMAAVILDSIDEVRLHTIPSVSYNKETRNVEVEFNQEVKTIPARALRLNCQCARCVDEFTGERQLKEEDVLPLVKPLKITPKGNYAASITWSDGHSTSLYPFQKLIDYANEGLGQ